MYSCKSNYSFIDLKISKEKKIIFKNFEICDFSFLKSDLYIERNPKERRSRL